MPRLHPDQPVPLQFTMKGGELEGYMLLNVLNHFFPDRLLVTGLTLRRFPQDSG